MAEVKMPVSTEEQNRVKNVTTGKVTVKKKSGGKKVLESFVQEDGSTVGNYIVQELLIPTFKDLLSNIVTNSVDMLLYGETRNRNNGRTNYNRIYDRNSRNRVQAQPASSRVARPKGGFSVDAITFASRSDADMVLATLRDQLAEYDQVSVGDYYNACDITPTWTDFNYGWYDLGTAHVNRNHGEWEIALPRAVALND